MNSWRWVSSLLLFLLFHEVSVAQSAKPGPFAQIPTAAEVVSRDGVDLAAWLPFGENISNRCQIDVSVMLASIAPVEGIVSVRLAGNSQVTTHWPVAFGPGVATTTLVLPALSQNTKDTEPKVVVSFSSRTTGVRGQMLELPYERWSSPQARFNYYGGYNDSVAPASLYQILILSDVGLDQWQLDLERVAVTTVIKPTMLPVGTAHLASFSLIILGKRAADLLTPEQCATLAQWVRSGGQLLITGGALGSPLMGAAFTERFGVSTRSTAASTIPVTIQLSAEDVNRFRMALKEARENNQANYYAHYSDDSHENLTFDLPTKSGHSDWRADTDSAALELAGYVMIDNGVRLNADLLINRRVEGMGTITTTSAVLEGVFDGSARSKKHNWILLPIIGYHWMRAAEGYPSMNGLRAIDGIQREAPPLAWQGILTTWAGIAPIDWRIVLGFLVAFFVVVTVVERLILGKLLKRLNWNWVTSLLIVVVFCALAQTISYASRGLTSLRRSMVIEDYPIGSGMRTLTFNSTTPSLNRTLALTLQHGSLLQIPEPHTSSQTMTLNVGMADTTMSTPSWTPCYFVSDSWDAQSTGPFVAELKANEPGEPTLRGTVRLERPIDGSVESMYLMWNGQVYTLDQAGDDWKPQASPTTDTPSEVNYDAYRSEPKSAGSTMASVLLDCLARPAMAAQSARSFYPARVVLPDYPRDYAVVICRYRSGKLPELTGLKMETESVHLIRQVVPISYIPTAKPD